MSGLTACGDYGKLERNRELAKVFENNQVDPGLRYFYFGRENMPYAIAGIDPRFTLASKFWHPVEPRTGRFEKMVYWIWTDHNYKPYGAYVVAPGGERVGVFYSSISRVVIKIDRTTRTVALTPDKPYLRGGP
jgi:hypothetical protein